MQLILASRDLMIGSRVEGAARKLGFTLVTAAGESQILERCAEDGPLVLLIDLRLPGLNVQNLVAAVRETERFPVPIIACAPHVHERSLTAAREAGCDLVITRGQLDRELESLLQQAIGE